MLAFISAHAIGISKYCFQKWLKKKKERKQRLFIRNMNGVIFLEQSAAGGAEQQLKMQRI